MSAGIHVIKIGGRALESPHAVIEFGREVAASNRPVVIVHGGGAEVSAWCRRMAIEPHFENGLRVTDSDTLEVAVAVLSGLLNRGLTARLRHAGVNAVGLAALDGGLLHVAAADSRLGAVGHVVGSDPKLLEHLLSGGFTPVVSSIAAEKGHLLNVNADDAAAAIAGALHAGALTLLSDVDGVRLGGRHVPKLSPAALEQALRHPDVTGGMMPKLAAAYHALQQGVSRVDIAAWCGAGTLDALHDGTAIATTIAPGVEDLTHA